ncbi:ankyrin repeat and sterile alpha motif domain-containing protein 1B isoform X4 [Callorhinchus milii]|uniref:ankyrin repeat and sterile alpha motif domain-containing protein 1B isoform X4 n=1 Tax=Callorhinchus milii TaxID=7868 RepID=UPI00045721FB|nr:ankyrin repeat and sterile alpha motif domain-containing protein 1B isoform X4 [Callorhinchus milii]|eukprot:gi/632978444/ref/XP_007905919.1/ PREDICTED: ankyrin repeat and sterile alpha motif domain-containing protein 1B isoform X4 [Callorhinchus milii]
MGKEQELLDAARTGNVAVVEKLLSGKRGLLGSGSSSIPLSSLLRKRFLHSKLSPTSIWRGPNVNCNDTSGYTALHHAALNGHKDVVLKLLQYEASTNVADNKGCFPLHLAAWKGDMDIVKILIHHGPSHSRVNEQNNENETALHCAAQYGHSDVVGVLLEEITDPTIRNNKFETPLDLAALYGRLQVVKMLINAHPNLMSCSNKKHTPLHLAARNGHKAVVEVLLEAGMNVNCQTGKGSALHEAALFGKMDVVRILLEGGIDANIKDSQDWTALDILKEHPSQKSQQITALIQGHLDRVQFYRRDRWKIRRAAPWLPYEIYKNDYIIQTMDLNETEAPIKQCPVPTPRASISSPAASSSHKTKGETLTGELSKLLSEIRESRDKDFDDLCQAVSSYSIERFSSAKICDEDIGKCEKQPKHCKQRDHLSPPIDLPPAEEEEEGEKSCGPTRLWEAFTPCNGCQPLGFPILIQEPETKKSNQALDIRLSPSLDSFPPEEEDNPYEFLATAVTKKPRSLDISRLSSGRTENAPQVTITAPEGNLLGKSTGPTPDCSPPSPDTALKNIEKVIRPQPKQRTSLISSLEVYRPRHMYDQSEVSSSAGYASFNTTPPVSPANYSIGSIEGNDLMEENLCQGEASAEEEFQDGHIPEQFAGLLHGSSPACEFPEDPYHLYTKANKDVRNDNTLRIKDPIQQPHLIRANLLQCTNETNKAQKLQTVGDKSILNQEYKQQVIYKTIFHTKVNQNHGETFVSTRTFCNRDHWVSNTEEKHGFEDRASTLGRVRSGGKTLLELQLTRNISKSDSNLITCSPIEEESRGSRYESVANYFKENKQCTGKCLERTPSFTAEWEEIDKIMSSIGAGINTGLKEKHEPASGPRVVFQTVGRWLESIGLPQYENHLLANGFDNIQFMGSNVVEDQDLLEIGILNSSHRQRILQAVRGLPRVKVIGYDGNSPTSVADWLDSLELNDYIKTFLANGYTSMDLVKKLWEIELINVLKINLLGHRKRILASLGDRLHDEPPQKPPRTITLRDSGNTPPQLSPSLSQSTYTGGSLDIPSAHLIMQGDARRRLNDSYFEDMPRSKLERQMAQQAEWSEPSITLRPPNEATSSTPVQYWQHHPEKLIFQSCDYEAYYLGSMLVKELRGTESTQDACSKMRKSSEQMKKIPTIILSISYKGVKFIDATNKNIITEHEIRNISCAAQDPEDLSTFAYITKDLKSSHHYCHVFSAFDVNLAYEIILTLGQAFEVAYQLALQARKGGHGLPSMQDSLENKIGKPIPKPRASIRKSVIDQPLMEQKTHTNVPWIVEPGQESKRVMNTKYETTIF